MNLTLLALISIGTGTAAITPTELDSHIRALCAPELAGRLTLAPGEKLAAEYIVREFRRVGLEAREKGGYIHEFPITVNHYAEKLNRLVFETQDGRRLSLELNKTYRPLVGSAEDKIVNAPVVFVGYGLAEPNWNDYSTVDVKGKVALMFRGGPQGQRRLSNAQKARIAAEAGAEGVVFIGPVDEGYTELPVPNRQQGIPANLGLVAKGVHRTYFDDLTGLDFAKTRAMTAPMSRELPVRIRAFSDMEPMRGMGQNVIGYLPGNDPQLKNEFVIVGAHYDHLGFGEVGSRTNNELIHPGADDNATGVAGVLALAEYYAMTRSNKRTMIFQAYSGEEVGLVGAAAWVRDHPELLKSTQMMLNMDMIGRLREGRLTIFGTATAKEFEPILTQIQVPGLTMNKVPASPPNSDHAPFARAGVPVLFFHTGLTDEYHTERDTPETINIAGMVSVLSVVQTTLNTADGLPGRLTFNPEALRMASGNRPRRARVGFMPDMTYAGEGVQLSGVSENSPAAKAGFRAGDVIIQIGSRTIKSLEDMQAALAEAQGGQKLKVAFRRNGQRMEVELTPEAPQG
jgi:hypothetical protein